MEKEEYLRTQMGIMSIGRLAHQLEIEEFLTAISKAESVIPVLDPAFYQKASTNLTAIRDLAKAILPVKEAFGKCFEAVVRTSMRGDMQPPPGKEL